MASSVEAISPPQVRMIRSFSHGPHGCELIFQALRVQESSGNRIHETFVVDIVITGELARSAGMPVPLGKPRVGKLPFLKVLQAILGEVGTAGLWDPKGGGVKNSQLGVAKVFPQPLGAHQRVEEFT